MRLPSRTKQRTDPFVSPKERRRTKPRAARRQSPPPRNKQTNRHANTSTHHTISRNNRIDVTCIVCSTVESKIICLRHQLANRERGRDSGGEEREESKTRVREKEINETIECSKTKKHYYSASRWFHNAQRRRRRLRRRRVRMESTPFCRSLAQHQHCKADSHHAQRGEKVLLRKQKCLNIEIK